MIRREQDLTGMLTFVINASHTTKRAHVHVSTMCSALPAVYLEQRAPDSHSSGAAASERTKKLLLVLTWFVALENLVVAGRWHTNGYDGRAGAPPDIDGRPRVRII